MRRVFLHSAVVVTALWLLVCVALYASALAGVSRMTEPLFLPLFFGSMAVGLLASQALRLADAAQLMPRPAVAAVCVAGFLCMAAQTAVNWRTVFGDLSGGALSGGPGDRYLNSHGTRVRGLTEEEYRYAEAAKWLQATAFFLCFSSITLGMALHSLTVWRTHRAGPALPQSQLAADNAPG